MDLKTQFYQKYANLPVGVRNDIIVVVDNEELTWNSLKLELNSDTEIGKKALLILVSLGILSKEK